MSARRSLPVGRARSVGVAISVVAALCASAPVSAQPGTTPRDLAADPPQESAPPPNPPQSRSAFQVRGLVDAGYTTFTAADTFRAVFGEPGGPAFGGGVQVVHRSGILFQLNASRFSNTGERVFVHEGEVFKLGIPLTATVIPLEFTGGYRFFTKPAGPPRSRPGAPPPAPRKASRFFPYVGGGVGFVSYREKSDFSDSDVSESFTSYHVLGGVDVPVSTWIGVGGEVVYRWVPDALGEAGVASEYGETDLGGLALKVRVTFGR